VEAKGRGQGGDPVVLGVRLEGVSISLWIKARTNQTSRYNAPQALIRHTCKTITLKA
jgi:hypothetical protein